ncbi:MAG: 8-oxo-dGTP diphosphatase MutT [Acidobacteria bacterium]|nr:MAG: 8-oxo-dGTP diphosphatase MutT [Acidobacteriota bacterium]
MSRLPDGERLRVAHGAGPRTMIVVVAAAVIERDGRFLVTRRQKGVYLEGCWEFPGGKCDDGESLTACIRRELREELAVDAEVGKDFFTVTHNYADRSVELHFFHCEVTGEPAPQIGQEMRWVRREELTTLEFPPADEELIRVLTLG